MTPKSSVSVLISEPSDLYFLKAYSAFSGTNISTKGIQGGIIRLHAGEKDTQESHSIDEVYYVIEGNGFIKLDGKDHEIKQGICIFCSC